MEAMGPQVSKKDYQFYIVPNVGGKPIQIANVAECRTFSTVISDVADGFQGLSKCMVNISFAIKKNKKAWDLVHRLTSRVYRYRTGIEPKWSNRTRKKQRLTRLQRRRKRQKSSKQR